MPKTPAKKQKRKQATPRQIAAAKALAENQLLDKPLSTGEVLKSVGYGTGLQNQPSRVLNSQGFQELLNQYLPDDLIGEKHKELLHAKRIEYFVFPKTMEDEEIAAHLESVDVKVIVIRQSDKGKLAFYSTDDARAKKDALDMAYKLKGRYAPEPGGTPGAKGDIYQFFFNAQAQSEVKTMESKIKEALMKPTIKHVQSEETIPTETNS